MVTQPKKIENLFPTDSTVFFLGSPYFGSEGTVLNPMLVYECGRLKGNNNAYVLNLNNLLHKYNYSKYNCTPGA